MEVENLAQVLKNNRTFADNDAIMIQKGYTLSDVYPTARLGDQMDRMYNISSSSAGMHMHKDDDQFTMDIIKPADSPKVLKLLKEFFFKDEPLNAYLNLGECKDLEDFSVKCIKDGCSFKAVDKKGEIIGVFLNGLMHRPKKNAKPEKAADSSKHPKFKQILQLMDYIGEHFDVFSLYPKADVILDGKILSVNTNQRGMGIGNKLTDRTLQYMRDNKIPVMHVLCTSQFSARVMEKSGFHEVYQLKYADYKVKNKVVFAPEPPHEAVRILVKEVK